ncbi:MAG: DUF2062 domain-containing protein [Alphaproteobacteria bacterium]|nr:DUF2062 domain-containing protein [Alphaproteobacteria bacterium]
MRKALRALWRQLRTEHTSPGRLAWAVGLGIWVGVLPFYGIHLPICIALAWLLRLNKVTMYLAANISNPLFAPALVAAGIVVGEWLRFGAWHPLDLDQGRDFIEQLALLSGQLPDLFLSCLLGDAVLGAALGAVVGPAVWLWARRRAAREAVDATSRDRA